MYKLKESVSTNNFQRSLFLKKTHYRKIGYNINILRQYVCLVVNPIMGDNYDTMTVLILEMGGLGPDILSGQTKQGLTVGFILLQYLCLSTVEFLSLFDLLFSYLDLYVQCTRI